MQTWLEMQHLQEDEERRKEEEDQNFLYAKQLALDSVFSCGICMTEERSEEDVFLIAECQHKMCRECARSYIKNAIAENQLPLKCPSCTAEKKINASHKEGEITQADATSVLSEEESQKLHKASLSLFIDKQGNGNYIHCNKPDCDGLVEMVGGHCRFECPICG